jgi:hypothetical protein
MRLRVISNSLSRMEKESNQLPLPLGVGGGEGGEAVFVDLPSDTSGQSMS